MRFRNIIGFDIVDNGIGFTEDNMRSFCTLDSDYKADKGGRGIGRLLWLKAFSEVKVNSIFIDVNGNNKTRKFSFNPTLGVHNNSIRTIKRKNIERLTCISLLNFSSRYRKYTLKTAQSIAHTLFEHCLWYFVRDGGSPHIRIIDSSETINLDDVYEEHMHSSAIAEQITIKGNIFNLIHIKLRANSASAHTIAYCASNRLVFDEKLNGKISGLHGKLSDGSGEFIYSCYVCSDLLDDSVRPERTGFNIIEDIGDLFANTEISFNDIRNAVTEKAELHLKKYLVESREKGLERVNNYASTIAPRYRPILSRIPPNELYVDPNASNKELDIMLHKHYADFEGEIIAEGHDVMTPKTGERIDEYKKRLSNYLSKADDLKKSDLANYVSHRKVILDLLESAIHINDEGKYAREDIIHELIMPMRQESHDVLLDQCNLWIIDERLAFHDYLASDKTISSMPISCSYETKEPDILALNVCNNPILVSEGSKLPLASIVVIEIKRPMRNDAATGEDNDPIEQALGYLERIRGGKITTAYGRPIPNSEDIPGFCYVICDLTPTILKRCKVHDLTRTSDGLGYFAYKESYKAYVEVISFDRLLNASKERNRAFFDKLGLPST
ncbi:MAG: ATP-binding protein [Armatimonadota bacterium]